MSNAVLDMVGKTLYDKEHQKIGKIDNIYVRQPNNEPVFASVSAGFLGSKETLVPISLTHVEPDGVVADAGKDVIKDAPTIGSGELTKQNEDAVYDYYEYILGSKPEAVPQQTESDQPDPKAGTPAQQELQLPNVMDTTQTQVPATPAANNEMTRSEEQMLVDANEKESRGAHPLQYVAPEGASTTIPLPHEEVRIAHEPASNQYAPGATGLSTEEHEVALRHETPIAGKGAVSQERVGMVDENVQDQQAVNDQFRKEQIYSEDDVPRQSG